MTKLKADLHSHTWISDGVFTVPESIETAKKAGLSHFAITDHDCVVGADEAAKMAENTDLGINIVYGVELSTLYNKESIHVLGYFKGKTDALSEVLDKQTAERRVRAIEMFDLIQRFYGVDVDRSEVYKKYSITRKTIGELVVRYSDLSPEFVTNNITSRESKCYIPSNKMSLSEGIGLIRDAGGLAVLAHPCLIKKSDPLDVLKYGFDGIEAVYPSVKNDEKRFRLIAKEKGLFVTGGSDFHTFNDNSDDHGVIGTSTIEGRELELFLERLYG